MEKDESIELKKFTLEYVKPIVRNVVDDRNKSITEILKEADKVYDWLIKP